MSLTVKPVSSTQCQLCQIWLISDDGTTFCRIAVGGLLIKGVLKKEINCYKDHLRCIFGQDSREKSLKAINQLQEAWLDDFKKYFNDRISPSLTKVCKWAIDKIRRFDPYSGITQNHLSFLRLHQYYVKEISRGRAGLGNYNLRPQYISAKIDLSEIVQFAVCKPQDIPVHRHPGSGRK